MAKLRALLVDLSGTLHISDQPTPNAANAIRRLRQAGIVLRWVSNTSKESKSSLLAKLHKMDLDVRESELFTSLSAVRQLVDEQNLQPLYLLSPSARQDFPPPAGSPKNLDSVVIGLATSVFDYTHLNEAFQLLSGEIGRGSGSDIDSDAGRSGESNSRKKPRLIATHRALYVREKDEKLSLGPGGFVTALEEASGIKAEVVGKPERKFFELALESLTKDGIERDQWDQVGMVGDDFRQDTGQVVQELGLKRFLVRTGKYRPGDELRLREGAAASERGESVQDPEWCGDSFDKVVDWVLGEEA